MSSLATTATVSHFLPCHYWPCRFLQTDCPVLQHSWAGDFSTRAGAATAAPGVMPADSSLHFGEPSSQHKRQPCLLLLSNQGTNCSPCSHFWSKVWSARQLLIFLLSTCSGAAKRNEILLQSSIIEILTARALKQSWLRKKPSLAAIEKSW